MNHLTPLKNHVQNDLFEKITWKMNRLKNHMQNESSEKNHERNESSVKKNHAQNESSEKITRETNHLTPLKKSRAK